MIEAPTPPDGMHRPVASMTGVTSLLGRVIAFALIVGAGAIGWFAIERYDVSIAAAGGGAPRVVALPDLGDGLPEARLQSPVPWRQFALTYQDSEQTNRFWVDLDRWQLRVESSAADRSSSVEIHGDRSFLRETADAEWVEQDVQTTRGAASWLMAGIGPFVLTDLVPPDTVGFTTLELEGTSRGERVYEVSVDSEMLQEQHPLAHQRWAAATRLVSDTSGLYRIRVREDGYIVRIDGDTSSVQWDDLDGGVVFHSPFALEAPPTPDTAPAVTTPPTVPAAPAADS